MISAPELNWKLQFGEFMNIEISLHKKQAMAFLSEATEILYGGAAGGGKSYLLRVKAISCAMQFPGVQIYLFRRQFSELVKNHLEGPGSFRALLEPYLRRKFCRIATAPPAIRFSNGSTIHLCHCRFDSDVTRFQGAEIHVLMVDELTHFTENVYRFLRGRCRLPETLRQTAQNRLPLILCGANPGGPGHNWVKRTFIDFSEPYIIRRMESGEGGMLRQYIPAKLEDNPSLNKADYEARLSGLKSPFLVRAMLDGSWDIVAGGMWDDVWNPEIHVVQPFEIPSSWRIDRSFDWGASKPYSVGFWAESDGSDVMLSDGSNLHTVRGDLLRIAEIYGWNGRPNEGSGDSPRTVASLILEKERSLGLRGRVKPGPADNSIFDSAGCASIASEMERAGVRWMRSDKTPGSRRRGWVLLRQLFCNAKTKEAPSLRVFSCCTHFIRTIPVLQRSERDADDIDTSAEDHTADETRYRILANTKRTTSGGIPL